MASVTTLTIPAGQSVSNSLDLRSDAIIRITMPSAWTNANLTFQISDDDVRFTDLVDASGREFTLRVVPDTSVRAMDDLATMVADGYIRLRSGSRNYPVIQAASRAFAVAVETQVVRSNRQSAAR
jgi:hypothetical protein